MTFVCQILHQLRRDTDIPFCIAVIQLCFNKYGSQLGLERM